MQNKSAASARTLRQPCSSRLQKNREFYLRCSQGDVLKETSLHPLRSPAACNDALRSDAEVAALIREGTLDILRLGKRNVREAWAEAKDRIWKALVMSNGAATAIYAVTKRRG